MNSLLKSKFRLASKRIAYASTKEKQTNTISINNTSQLEAYLSISLRNKFFIIWFFVTAKLQKKSCHYLNKGLNPFHLLFHHLHLFLKHTMLV